MKTRYFPFDGFLSHNRDDGSHILRDQLAQMGARVWHDGYADITDRRVQSRVRAGLVESRYICVCIGSAFRDSEWVQTEYRSGLDIEGEDPGKRVVVIATDAAPAIPALLKRHPVFPVHAEGPEQLARFLVAQNSRDDSGLQGLVEENRIAAALGLRSILNGKTRLNLSEVEQMRLVKERLSYVLASADKTAANFEVSQLAYRLGHEGWRYMLKGYFLDDEIELRALALDIYEALSREPAAVEDFYTQRNPRDVLDPLIDLMRFPAETARARLAFEAIIAALDQKWRTDRFTRKHADIYRWHAKQVLKGKPFAQTREERDRRLRR